MSARVLVVDDSPTALKIIEAQLTAEYFTVVCAENGETALQICGEQEIDVVLLDVLMPGMDGIEVCTKLKSDAATAHIPVIMVTQLNAVDDRVKALEAGADEFLSKPIQPNQLLARLKSLVRLKSLTDELRLRANPLVIMPGQDLFRREKDAIRSDIIYVGESDQTALKSVGALEGIANTRVIDNAMDAFQLITTGQCQSVLVAGHAEKVDPLRVCAELRALEATRSIPIILIVDSADNPQVMRGLELGITDFIVAPIEVRELQARVRTQIRRKRYHDALRSSLTQTLEMALVDPLTGLNNRRYLQNHMETLFARSTARQQPLALMMIDLDHFKAINDTHGHEAGDQVLAKFAQKLRVAVREMDLVCRYGGEEFIVLMPDTTAEVANQVAERLLSDLGETDIPIDADGTTLRVTASVGLTVKDIAELTPTECLKKADEALYEAKHRGRNCVVMLDAA